MNLHSLLGLPETINGETLPQYLNRTTRSPKPKPDPVEAAFAQHREEQRQQDTYDHIAMLETVRRKRDNAATPDYSADPIKDAGRRWQTTKRWNEILQQMETENDE
jgi:hypothetical protein